MLDFEAISLFTIKIILQTWNENFKYNISNFWYNSIKALF